MDFTLSFHFTVTLEREKSREALDRVYGLLSGLIACTTGHRKGVITNLMVKEFMEAESDEQERRILRVRESIMVLHIEYFPFHIWNVNC